MPIDLLQLLHLPTVAWDLCSKLLIWAPRKCNFDLKLCFGFSILQTIRSLYLLYRLRSLKYSYVCKQIPELQSPSSLAGVTRTSSSMEIVVNLPTPGIETIIPASLKLQLCKFHLQNCTNPTASLHDDLIDYCSKHASILQDTTHVLKPTSRPETTISTQDVIKGHTSSSLSILSPHDPGPQVFQDSPNVRNELYPEFRVSFHINHKQKPTCLPSPSKSKSKSK